jgi:hypothetical protein
MIAVLATAILPEVDPLPLPAPAWLLRILLLLTFYLHLLAMNAMLGGLLITLWARLRSRQPGDPWSELADTIAGTTPSLVAATVTLGVAPLLFLQALMGQFFFTSSILMGWGWFSVVVVLIFAYYGTYLQSFRREKLGPARTPLLLLTVLLFLWIAFMFANNTSLMAAVSTWAERYFRDPGGLYLNLTDATLAPRYLHAVLGAVALAGLMLAWWGRVRVGRDHPSGLFLLRTGWAFFTWVTAVNLLLGIWYLLALPDIARRAFMGANLPATVLLGSGIVLAVLMVVLGWRSRNKMDQAPLVPVTLLAAVVLAVMVMTRDTARAVLLGNLYRPGSFVVETQVLNLVLFGVLLVMGVAVLVWMVSKLKQAWG